MNKINKIYHSGLIDKNKMSRCFDDKMKNMSDLKELLIVSSNPNLRNENGDPVWYITMKSDNKEGLLFLLNNGADITIRNRNNDSWTLSCMKFNMPKYILIAGLNKENEKWNESNYDDENPFFFENISKEYAETIANKYWGDLKKWSLLKNKYGEKPVDFFKNKGKFEISKVFNYWESISLRG